MNWQRIFLLLRFDLYYGLLRMRAWVFLLPFFLCWFAIFRQLNKGVAEMLQSQEGIMITSAIYGTDGAVKLFIDHPPSVSLFYLFTLSSLPFFAVLAAYDQFSSDLGSGFFRFLIARCRRVEIFLARILGAFFLIAGAFLIVAVICAVLSVTRDAYPVLEVLLYSARVYLTLLLYALPFIVYMSFISALVSSALASLFLGFLGFAVIWVLNLFTFFAGREDIFSYFLASSMRQHLVALDTGDFFTGLAILPAYVIVYGLLAFHIFNRRDL